jgi:hypothetical protein
VPTYGCCFLSSISLASIHILKHLGHPLSQQPRFAKAIPRYRHCPTSFLSHFFSVNRVGLFGLRFRRIFVGQAVSFKVAWYVCASQNLPRAPGSVVIFSNTLGSKPTPTASLAILAKMESCAVHVNGKASPEISRVIAACLVNVDFIFKQISRNLMTSRREQCVFPFGQPQLV